MSGWKEVSSDCSTEGGHGPFRELDAPYALRFKVEKFPPEVNGDSGSSAIHPISLPVGFKRSTPGRFRFSLMHALPSPASAFRHCRGSDPGRMALSIHKVRRSACEPRWREFRYVGPLRWHIRDRRLGQCPHHDLRAQLDAAKRLGWISYLRPLAARADGPNVSQCESLFR